MTQIDPETRPSNIGPPSTAHFRILADTPRGIQSFIPGPDTSITSGKPHASTERGGSGEVASTLEIRRNIYDERSKDVTPKNADGSDITDSQEVADRLKKDKKTIFCYSCGKDTTRLRWHNSKNPPANATTPRPNAEQRYDICSMCYQEKRFPSSADQASFVKLEEPEYRSLGEKDAPWSDTETLLLLEGLEMFDDNWESVADHVGSRTREECVMKFLQLEIEDKYLDERPELNGVNGARGDYEYLNNGRLPYAQFENPVMSVMGFLATLADPATTAAATGRTIEETKRIMRKRIEKDTGVTNGTTEDASANDVKAETDGMELDVVRSDQPDKTQTDLAATALGLTAARAAAMASHTERQLTAQISAAVNLQLQKLDLKMQQFNEMEALLQAERREVERGRQRLFLDRLDFRRKVRALEERMGGVKLDTGDSADDEKMGFEAENGIASDVAGLGDAEDVVRLEI